MKYKVFVDELKKAQSEGYKWAAQDYTGLWCAYESKPVLDVGVWLSPAHEPVFSVYALFDCPNLKPESSLFRIDDIIKKYE